MTLEHAWQLSLRWYADRMAASFRGRSAAGARLIFAQLGLNGDFWRVP